MSVAAPIGTPRHGARTRSKRRLHLHQLAASLGAELIPATTLLASKAHLDTRVCEVPEENSVCGYWVALHELGHVATLAPEAERRGVDWFALYQEDVIYWEAVAWLWAAEHAREPMDARTRKVAVTALGSYRGHYAWQLRTRPEAKQALRKAEAVFAAGRAVGVTAPERMAAYVAELAQELAVDVRYCLDEPTEGRYLPATATIELAPIVDDFSFLVAMHELGHAGTRAPLRRGDETWPEVVHWEAVAWLWATDHFPSWWHISADIARAAEDALLAYARQLFPYEQQPDTFSAAMERLWELRKPDEPEQGQLSLDFVNASDRRPEVIVTYAFDPSRFKRLTRADLWDILVDRIASLTWRIAAEDELQGRGYVTRDEQGRLLSDDAFFGRYGYGWSLQREQFIRGLEAGYKAGERLVASIPDPEEARKALKRTLVRENRRAGRSGTSGDAGYAEGIRRALAAHEARQGRSVGLRAEHYAEAVRELRRDPIIQQLAREVGAMGLGRDELHGWPMLAALGREYVRRGGVVPAHFGGPHEAVLALLDSADQLRGRRWVEGRLALSEGLLLRLIEGFSDERLLDIVYDRLATAAEKAAAERELVERGVTWPSAGCADGRCWSWDGIRRSDATRDVRFTDAQLRVIEHALRDEVKRRSRSISKAEANIAAGNKVQEGTLREHYASRGHASTALEAVRVARRQLRGYGWDGRRGYSVMAFTPRVYDPPQYVAEDRDELAELDGSYIPGPQCDGCGNWVYRVEGDVAVCANEPGEQEPHGDPCGSRYPIQTWDEDQVVFP